MTEGKAAGDRATEDKDEGRARHAKGLVAEAIGKIIGDPAVEKQGLSESKAGARQAKRGETADNTGED